MPPKIFNLSGLLVDGHKVKIGDWIQLLNPIEDVSLFCQLQHVYQMSFKKIVANQQEHHLYYWLDVNECIIQEICDSGHYRLQFSHRSILPFLNFDFVVVRRVYVYLGDSQSFYLNIHMDNSLRQESGFALEGPQ